MRIGIRVERLVVRSSAANLLKNDHCNGVQVQLHRRISAAILLPADPVNPFPSKGATTYWAHACEYKSPTEPTHTKGLAFPVGQRTGTTASTITTKEKLNKSKFITLPMVSTIHVPNKYYIDILFVYLLVKRHCERKM